MNTEMQKSLEKQMALLSDCSKDAQSIDDLAMLSRAMVEIADVLKKDVLLCSESNASVTTMEKEAAKKEYTMFNLMQWKDGDWIRYASSKNRADLEKIIKDRCNLLWGADGHRENYRISKANYYVEAEKAEEHFGEIEGNIIYALSEKNNGYGGPGGFTINGVTIHPQNCGETTKRYRIIIDFDTEYHLMLIRAIEQERG